MFRLIVISVFCLLAKAADPLAGTWVANIEKSKRDQSHQFQKATLKIEVDGDKIRLNSSGVNMAGKEVSETTEVTADGKERPIPAAPGIMLVVTRRGADTLEMVTKKDGALAGKATYKVSSDQKTLTAEVSGTDEKGRRFESSVVFDRQ